MRLAPLLSLGGVLVAAPALGAEPWFSSKACMEATALAYAARTSEAKQRADALTASKDLDERACGLWLYVSSIEMEIALYDGEEQLFAQLAQRLDALEKFGLEEGYRAPRFSDLVVEAKLRRVHRMVRLSERTAAIRAVKEAKALLEQRRRVKKKTPTYFYAEAVANLAVSRASFPVRAILRLVGIESDEERGKKAMDVLLAGKSVYRSEGILVARNFELGPKLDYSESLWRAFPNNPQLAYDHAVDLHAKQRCSEVPSTMAQLKLDGFGKKVRQKVANILETCKAE
jgi:hypothetical protein